VTYRVFRRKEVWRDGEDGECQFWQERSISKKEGWVRHKGKDYCPCCVKQLRASGELKGPQCKRTER